MQCSYCFDALRMTVPMYRHGCKGCESRGFEVIAHMKKEDREQFYDAIERAEGKPRRREIVQNVMLAWHRIYPNRLKGMKA